MLPHSGGKSRKYSTHMSPISRAMAIEANSIETRNVIVIVLTMPSRAVCHEKYLNVGLKKQNRRSYHSINVKS